MSLFDSFKLCFEPTSAPTFEPTSAPVEWYSAPTFEPTSAPVEWYSAPTFEPTSAPTQCTCMCTSDHPTPTATPTFDPTTVPTSIPTSEPTSSPTATPTSVPTAPPTPNPTAVPSKLPTSQPTLNPTAPPTLNPTAVPSKLPTFQPTAIPTPPPTSPHTGYTGSSSPNPFSIVNPYLGFNFVIALTGVFPPRGRRLSEINATTLTDVQKYSHRRLGSDTFLGEIMAFSGNFAPNGYAFCQGQLLSIAQNTALFSLLGTFYGGNGQSTFALPDLRGRVTLNSGQGAGLSPYDLGEISGAESQALISSNLPSHLHTIPTGGNTQSTGSNIPISIIQPSLTINYIISLYGVFPSQSRRLHESTHSDINTARFHTEGYQPYVGELAIFAGNFAPLNWALCNGQILSIADYETLFILIGKMFRCITHV